MSAHGGVRHICPVCEQSFTTRSNRTRHVNLKHAGYTLAAVVVAPDNVVAAAAANVEVTPNAAVPFGVATIEGILPPSAGTMAPTVAHDVIPMILDGEGYSVDGFSGEEEDGNDGNDSEEEGVHGTGTSAGVNVATVPTARQQPTTSSTVAPSTSSPPTPYAMPLPVRSAAACLLSYDDTFRMMPPSEVNVHLIDLKRERELTNFYISQVAGDSVSLPGKHPCAFCNVPLPIDPVAIMMHTHMFHLAPFP